MGQANKSDRRSVFGRLTIRTRLLLAVWGVVTVVAALYAYLLYDTQKFEYRQGVDAKLLTAAQMARGTLGENFHNLIIDETSISKAAHLANVARFNALSKTLGFQYLWSNLFLKDGRIVFTSGTSTSKDVSKGDHALFFDVHSDPASFQSVIDSGATAYSSFHNEWGDGRMVLVPFTDSHGRRYVFGASISMATLSERLRETALQSILIFAAVFFVGSLVSTAIANAISRPVQKLTRTAEGIASGKYGLHVDEIGGGAELTSLAHSVNAMSTAIYAQHQDSQNTVSQLQETRDDLRRSQQHLEQRVSAQGLDVRKLTQALEQSPHMVLITNLDGAIEYVNRRFTELTGYSAEDVLGRNPRILQSGETDGAIYADMWTTLLSRGTWNGEIKDRRKNGDYFWAAMTVSQVRDETGLPTHYVALHEDITERKIAEAELRQAKEQAEIANSAKSDFLSHMSHELRTPLNAILGFSQLLETDPANPLDAEQQESISHIKQSGHHLLTLIDQVLDLAKIESGKMALSIEAMEPLPAMASCRAMAETLARKKGIVIDDQARNLALPAIRADATRFKQVLLNFLSNAIKYNSHGGAVRMDAELVPGRYLRFLVSDSGRGIPENRHHELFQPFRRLGQEAGLIEGTGIGLSISRELIERMGGNLGFDSTEGDGSTFWFELPLADKSISEISALASPVALPEVSYDLGVEKQNQRLILYVEDNPANCNLMRHILQRVPNVVLVTTETGEEGLIVAEEERPDLILMDINLPGMDGIEVLAHLRDNATTADIPVIAVSALAMPRDIKKGGEAGFVEYLTKPIRVHEVLRAVGAAFDEDVARAD